MTTYPITLGEYEIDAVGSCEYAVYKAEDMKNHGKCVANFFTSKKAALAFVKTLTGKENEK
jgi:hypothetical protein